MAEVLPQIIGITGVELAEGAAAAGDSAQVGSNKYLIVRNGSGASVTVTMLVPGNDPISGLANLDPAIIVPAGKTRIIPILSAYADPALNGQAGWTYSATASVTRSVVAYT